MSISYIKIIASPYSLYPMPNTPYTIYHYRHSSGDIPMTNTISIDQLKEHVRVLSEDIGSRSLSEPVNLSRAADYIEKAFRKWGYDVQIQEFDACGVRTANITAAPEDWDPSSPSLLLGAHYDTVPGTPGADDNASGVAVLLEVARVMGRKEDRGGRNHMFTAFSAEEPPAFSTREMGSRVFVKSLKDGGWNVAGALVLEMVGYFRSEPGSQHIPLFLKPLGFPNTGDFIAVVGNGNSRKLVERVVEGLEGSGAGLPVSRLTIPGSGALVPEARLSDNASFWDAGIPAVMITDTSFFRNPHYHRFSDRLETLDIECMSRLAAGLVHFMTDNRGRSVL